MRLIWMLCVIFAAALAAPAYAWGPQGHRLTCDIAYRTLDQRDQQAIDRLLRTQQPKYRNFADACLYADDNKDHDGRRAQHFLNLERTSAGLSAGACPVTTGAHNCLLAAIDDDLARLRDQHSAPANRALALMYLGHWIGDLHQPLHISYRDDIGGNDLQTEGICGGTNLHGVWDSCIIIRRIYAPVRGRPVSSDPRFAATVATLLTSFPSQNFGAWQSGQPWNWANESYNLTRRRRTGYCALRIPEDFNSACQARSGSVLIDNDYLDYAEPIVREQLVRGGIRLAGLLHAALNN